MAEPPDWGERSGQFGVSVEWSRTSLDESTRTLAKILDGPTVGIADPVDGVELPDSVMLDPTPRQLRVGHRRVDPVGNRTARSLSGPPRRSASRRDDIVPTMAAAFKWLGPRLREAWNDDGGDEGRCGSAIIATGPSATADMGALVRGAHGPKAVHVVIVDSDDGSEVEGDDGDARE